MTFQLGASLLDACVLAILHHGDVYGYKLTQEVKTLMQVSESTLYPVLRRLKNEGCLKTYDEEHMGRYRRYYRLTEKGRERYSFYVKEWQAFRCRIDAVLMEGENEDEA